MHSGLHPSLHPNFHHQFVSAKFSLTKFSPPSYKQLDWRYQQPNNDLIKRAIRLCEWKKVFLILT